MNEKRHWAVIGAGNGGQAFSAYFSMMGIDVALYDTFQTTVDELNKKGGVELTGNCRHTGFGKIAFAGTDIKKVMDGAELIWVILPSLYHRSIAEKMAPYLKDGQTVILNPISPLGPIEFQNVLESAGCKANINLAATNTLLFACRLSSVGRVNVSGQKKTVAIAAYPGNKNEMIRPAIESYLPEFNFVSDILKVSMDNPNFELHPGPTMLYTALIEKKIPFEYYTDFVPSQITLIKAMDKERMAICRAFGIHTDDITVLFRKMYGYEGDLCTMLTTADCYKGIAGPGNLNVRYLTEDVPYALRPVQMLGKIAGIKTPVIDTVINLAYILLGDKLDEGRTPEKLGFSQNTTVEAVAKLCRG